MNLKKEHISNEKVSIALIESNIIYVPDDYSYISFKILCMNKKLFNCTAYKKSDGWITCYSQGQPKYQIPITEIKMIEYKKNQNIK